MTKDNWLLNTILLDTMLALSDRIQGAYDVLDGIANTILRN
jgi:hypothetical protein